MALQTGTIDGVFTNYDGLHMMKFDEVAPNLLISKSLWFATPFLHLMNADTFAKLPDDVRQGVLKAGEIAEQRFGAVYNAAFEKVRSEQIKAGYTVNELSSADVVAWENRSELVKLQAEWVEAAKKAGLANAADLMEKMRGYMKQALAR